MNWLKKYWFIVFQLFFFVVVVIACVIAMYTNQPLQYCSLALAAYAALVTIAKSVLDFIDKQREQVRKEADNQEKITGELVIDPEYHPERLQVLIYNSGKTNVTIKRVALCCQDKSVPGIIDIYHAVYGEDPCCEYTAIKQLAPTDYVFFRYYQSNLMYKYIMSAGYKNLTLKAWSFKGEVLSFSGEDIYNVFNNYGVLIDSVTSSKS